MPQPSDRYPTLYGTSESGYFVLSASLELNPSNVIVVWAKTRPTLHYFFAISA